MKVLVSEVGFEREEIVSGVQKILDELNPIEDPEPEEFFLFKPNLTSDKPSIYSGIVTNTHVVEGAVAWTREKFPSARLAVVDSDSDGTADRAFDRLGYRNLQDRYGLELIRLDTQPFYKLQVEKGLVRSLSLPEVFFEATRLVNIATLKRHVHERITCCWKNMWGIPSCLRERLEMHPFLREALLALNTHLVPSFCLVDAVTGLQGPGPLEGTPVPIGKVLASTDMLAVDWAAAKMLGDKAKKVPILRHAMKKLKFDPKEIQVQGEAFQVHPLKWIPPKAFFFYRLGLRLRRLSLRLNNLATLLWLTGYAMRLGSVGEYAGGGIQTLRGSLKMAKDFALRFEVARRIYG